MAVTIPALFALAYRIPKYRDLLGVALVLVAIPWEDIVENATVTSLASIAVVAAVVATTFWRRRRRAAALATAAAFALGIAERLLRLHFPPSKASPAEAIAAVAAPTALAETTWEAFIETTQAGNAWHFFFAHLPTWLGVTVLVVVACAAARTSDTADSRNT
jgi:disulfide bond formation protein DsbB